MDILLLGAYAVTIFISILRLLVIIDVILSWLSLAGLNWRPKFLADLIDPVYAWIKSIIPTSFGPVDFTPIIVILALGFLELFMMGLFPDISLLNNVN